jgi:uncharacterized membrane protein
MKSWLTKIFFEFLDTFYMVIGSIIIIIAYIYSSDGLLGIPASPWVGLVGVIIAFIILLLPYYVILKYKHNKRLNKDA